MKHQIANIITSLRILSSIGMLFFPVGSVSFAVLYLFCGLTDLLDGPIARKTNSVSQFGSELDTAADMTFAAASLLKILPMIHIPVWLWIWICAIGYIKINSHIQSLIHAKKLLALHTMSNKITGLLLFLLPLTLPWIDLRCSAPVVCIAATFSAMAERHCAKQRK